MNRKQKAIEERYKKHSEKNLESYSKKERRAYLEKEAWEKTRDCTLAEVLEELNSSFKGLWTLYYVVNSEYKWMVQRDDIIKVARKKAEENYTRNKRISPWEIDPEWDLVMKEEATKEWKLRQTKLYKALK